MGAKAPGALRNFSAIKSVRHLGSGEGPARSEFAEDFPIFGARWEIRKVLARLHCAEQIDFLREVSASIRYRENRPGNLNRGGQEFVEFLFPNRSTSFCQPSTSGKRWRFDACTLASRADPFMKALTTVRRGQPLRLKAVVFHF